MKMVWNVPNILSVIRLALVPLIAASFLLSNRDPNLIYVFLVALIVSGLSDVVDGYIARKFNQITDIGKILDPLADKLTQLTVLVCLTIHYLEILPLTVICLCKEGMQLIGGLLLLNKGQKIRSSKWFGKLSTVTFYTAVVLFVAFPKMPAVLHWGLIVLVGGMMVFAFVNYTRIFKQTAKEMDPEETELLKSTSEE